jgi:23S rRNA maturation-related 3'-5' exoribonuclease YhaM
MIIETYIPISKMTVGSSYKQVFFLKDFNIKFGKNKKPYARITVSDTSGTITGYCWDYNGKNIKSNEFYVMEIVLQENLKPLEQVQFFTKQESISQYKEIPLNIEDYFECPNMNLIASASDELEHLIAENITGYYSEIIQNAISRGIIRNLKNSAYGTTGKLAIQGGLLIHTIYVARGALALAASYKESDVQIDTSLILTAAILRNIGWSKVTVSNGSKVRTNQTHSMLTPESATLFEINTIINKATNDLIHLQTENHDCEIIKLINCCYDSMEKIQSTEGKIVFLADKSAQLITKK